MPVNRSNPERRYNTGEVEVRARNGKAFIGGHAAVFNKLSQNLGGFVERIRPGAFTKTIGEADVRALFNHDASMILGRNTSGTLELEQDDIGLLYRIFPGTRSYERDLIESMERRDIRESSFGFFAVEEDWGMTEQGFPVRDIVQASLVDISVVTYPAYLDSDAVIGKRSALTTLEKRSGVAMDEMLADPEAIKCAVGKCISDSNEPGETHSGLSEEDQRALDRLIALDAELRGNQ